MRSNLTQGTVITSIRSQKYKNQSCYGIIISARCDIANNKISKIYYLEAVSLEDWIVSETGFKMITKSTLGNINSQIESILKKANLSWDTLKRFNKEDFETVVTNEIKKPSDLTKSIELFKKYREYNDCITPFEERKILLQDNKKNLERTISDISNGKHSHFSYIPENALNSNIQHGLIVDLQEVDYFDMNTVNDLINCAIDNENLTLDKKTKEKYNNKFSLDIEPGYAIALCVVKSPWIEYLLQHFSNSFARIGVDNPDISSINQMLTTII